jgi:hypothetical protein
MAAPLPSPNTVSEAPAAVHDATPLHLDPMGNVVAVRRPAAVEPVQSEDLAWWAEGLLKAVVAADTSEAGEPVLAAAGNAAAAALMLVQHHERHDGDLREMYDVSADQLAIVRELMHTTPAPTVRASAPMALPSAPAPAPSTPRPAGVRHRRRRLRLVRSR